MLRGLEEGGWRGGGGEVGGEIGWRGERLEGGGRLKEVIYFSIAQIIIKIIIIILLLLILIILLLLNDSYKN